MRSLSLWQLKSMKHKKNSLSKASHYFMDAISCVYAGMCRCVKNFTDNRIKKEMIIQNILRL